MPWITLWSAHNKGTSREEGNEKFMGFVKVQFWQLMPVSQNGCHCYHPHLHHPFDFFRFGGVKGHPILGYFAPSGFVLLLSFPISLRVTINHPHPQARTSSHRKFLSPLPSQEQVLLVPLPNTSFSLHLHYHLRGLNY